MSEHVSIEIDGGGPGATQVASVIWKVLGQAGVKTELMPSEQQITKSDLIDDLRSLKAWGVSVSIVIQEKEP